MSQEAVEVEQRCRTQRVNVVPIVEGIEHLDDGDKRIPLAKLEWTLQSPIKREILIVFPQCIPVGRRSHRRSDWLRRAGLHAEITFQAPRAIQQTL